jgi:hypothetical protein
MSVTVPPVVEFSRQDCPPIFPVVRRLEFSREDFPSICQLFLLVEWMQYGSEVGIDER